MKEFNSQVCTTKIQSQRLLELGLKPETADMAHISFGGGGMMRRPYNWVSTTEVDINNFYPAWSLHRLIELFTNSVTNESDAYILNTDDAFDAVIDDIEWCINKGYINKEYLK